MQIFTFAFKVECTLTKVAWVKRMCTKICVHLQNNVPLTDSNLHLYIFMYIAIKVKIYKVECTLTKMYNNKVTIYKAECTLIRMYVHLESFMCLFNTELIEQL